MLCNMYPVSIHTEICDQNSPHRLSGDSKQLTLTTHRRVWAARNRISDVLKQQRFARSLMILVVQSVVVDFILYDLSCGPYHEFWIIDPSIDHCMIRKFTTSIVFLIVIEFCGYTSVDNKSNYKHLLLSYSYHLENQTVYTF